VLAGEGVQLAGARHHVQHVGEVGRGAQRVGEGLDLLHELGVFDLVERAAAVGHLQAGLELAVALARPRHFPLAAVGVQASIWKGLPPARRVGGRCCRASSPLTGPRA
jgi:hypothetical protein